MKNYPTGLISNDYWASPDPPYQGEGWRIVLRERLHPRAEDIRSEYKSRRLPKRIKGSLAGSDITILTNAKEPKKRWLFLITAARITSHKDLGYSSSSGEFGRRYLTGSSIQSGLEEGMRARSRTILLYMCFCAFVPSVAQQPQLVVQTGPFFRTMSVAFSPDGHTLAAAGSDKTIKLWDVTSGRELQILTGHSAEVESVTFCRDENWCARTAGGSV